MTDSTQGVREMLSRSMNIDTTNLKDDDHLFSSGLIDSFALLELITVIESTFSIRITPDNAVIENLDSITGIASLIEKCAN